MEIGQIDAAAEPANVISGMVWVISWLIVVATKVSFFARSASVYWE